MQTVPQYVQYTQQGLLMTSNSVYLFCLQSFGPVPAATLQVPPLWPRYARPHTLNLHQVCQPVPRDKINHSRRKSPLPLIKACISIKCHQMITLQVYTFMFIISASSPYIQHSWLYIHIYTLHGREISKLQKIRLKLLKNVKKKYFTWKEN